MSPKLKKKSEHTSSQIGTHESECMGGAYARLDSESRNGNSINGLGCAFNLLKSLVESLLARTFLYVGFPTA
jgi:hypothetical protein